MKALIPVAGAGTRLRPHTYTQPKPLIPVAGKPIIAFLVDELLNAGITEFVFVIGYLGDKIQEYIEHRYPGLNTKFVHQEHRMGLGHAVWLARDEFKPGEGAFIALGDIIFDADLKAMLNSGHNCIALKKVEDPRKFGVAQLDELGMIKTVVEKPLIPKSNLAIAGLYKIDEYERLVQCIQYNIDNNIRTRDEFQLTDGLSRMLATGAVISQIEISSWYDCGMKDILLETNAMLLKRHGQVESQTPELENTILIPPVYIGKDCKIKNSIIGPCVSIGDNTIVNQSIIQESIIGNFAEINGVVLQKSVIGNDAAIKGLSQSLNIGDNTEIDFS